MSNQPIGFQLLHARYERFHTYVCGRWAISGIPLPLLTLELLPHGQQFLSVVRCRLGEGHLEPLQRLQYDVGDEQSGGEFVIGWNNVPRCLGVLVADRQSS